MVHICDNCLTAAYDEVSWDPEACDNYELQKQICLNQGADIADHVCLVTEGYEDRCDCACRKGK